MPNSAEAWLALDDERFERAWCNLKPADRATLSAEVRQRCVARFLALTPYIGASIAKFEQADRRTPRVNGAGHALVAPSIELVCGADVELQPVVWLWRDWLAAGALHILAGAPGAGKSTLVLAFAATITSGGRWPDGSRAQPGDVVGWSGEDNVANTLKPRLVAMGADVSRVHFVRRTFDEHGPREFDPATDLHLLREALRKLTEEGRPARLVALDPIVSAVRGDSNKAAETRRALQPIRDLAEELGCAVVGVSHYTKWTAGRDPVERVVGSVTFGAVPRLIFGAAKVSQEDGGGRIFVKAKNNLGPDTGGFRYDLEPVEVAPVDTVRVSWGAAVEGTARELLARAEEAQTNPAGTIATAGDFLRDLLADGPVPAKQVRGDADGAGYHWRTVQEAADRIGVERKKPGMREGWVWALPKAQGGPKMHEDANLQTLRLRASSGGLASSEGATDAPGPPLVRCPRCDGEGCPHCDPEAAREAAEERSAQAEPEPAIAGGEL